MENTTKQIATPVRLHHVPNWIRLRCLKVFGCRSWNTTGEAVLRNALSRSAGDEHPYWLDHWGSTKTTAGQVAFVSEPYGLTEECEKQIENFADSLNLEVIRSDESEWFPGRTIRVTFLPADHVSRHKGNPIRNKK